MERTLREGLRAEAAEGRSWDRAGATLALARSLFEGEEVALAALRTWPGVDEAAVVAAGGAGEAWSAPVGEGWSLVVRGAPDDAVRAALDDVAPLFAASRARGAASEAAALDALAARAEVAELRSLADELLAVVGHDLRSPLAILSGHCQLLEEGLVAPAAVPRTAETLRRQSERLGAMLDALLPRLQVANEVLDALPGDGSADRVVAGALVGVRKVADARGVAVRLVEGEPRRADAPHLLRRAVALVGHAAALTLAPEGVVRVEVTGDDEGLRVDVRAEGPAPRNGRADPGALRGAAARLARAVGGSVTREARAAPGEGGPVERVLVRWPWHARPVEPEAPRDPATGLALAPPGPPAAPVLLLALADPEELAATFGAGSVGQLLTWLAGVVLLEAGPRAHVRRDEGPTLRVDDPDAAPGWLDALGRSIEATVAGARPRVGPHRVGLRVRARVIDGSTIQSGTRPGGRIDTTLARSEGTDDPQA